MQAVDCDLNHAMTLLAILRQTLEDSRNRFSDIYGDACKIYYECNLNHIRRRHLRSSSASNGEIEEDEALNMFNELINSMLFCLDKRFAEHDKPLYLALGALQPMTAFGDQNLKFLDWAMIKPLYEKYLHLIPDEAINVEMQLIFLKTTLENLPPEDGGHPSNTRTVWKYLEHHGKQICRSALMLYRIAHVLPVVTASAERTFSRLSLVKTALRSTMSEERLDPLMLLSLNRDIDLDIEEVIDNFGNFKNRRLLLT